MPSIVTAGAFVARGKRLLRQRGERLERPCAHLYVTGRMHRLHLRGHDNILKRLLIHTGAFNLGLLMRELFGVGTPRSLQGHAIAFLYNLWSLLRLPQMASKAVWTCPASSIALSEQSHTVLTLPMWSATGDFATGC
jgi:hypothetical protein